MMDDEYKYTPPTPPPTGAHNWTVERFGDGDREYRWVCRNCDATRPAAPKIPTIIVDEDGWR